MTKAAKVTKASVGYRTASPTRFWRRCGSCAMYRTGGSCTLVAGRITPTALCDRWEPK